MSQIVTLYSDKEKTDALYPRTKVSAISDDNNTPLKELMTGMVKQEEGGTEEEVVTPINADTLGGKLTADNVVFYEEEMVDEFGQVVVKNADKLENHPANYFATSEDLNTAITNGTLKIDLLWTNASLTSEFIGQTVSIDLSRYDLILISYFYENNGRYNKCAIFKKNIFNEALLDFLIDTSNYVCRLITSINDNGIVFGTGLRNGSSDNNSFCIPYQIYGVR